MIKSRMCTNVASTSKLETKITLGCHTQYVVLFKTCFCDGEKARTGNILNMTNLKYSNNREAVLTVIFATH